MIGDVSLLQGADARAFGVAVIDELVSHALAPSAANYELWLTYRLSADAALCAAIDGARATATLTQPLCDALYERHCSHGRLSGQILEANQSIARELADVVASLRSAGAQTRSYGETLSAAAALDATDIDPALFQSLVRELASATRAVTAQNQKLTEQIDRSAAEVETLQTALTHVSVAALTDGLTGIANRRHFETKLQQHVDDATRDGAPFCLILGDIDHFKRINDTWGHPVGDQVIRYVAKVLVKLTPAGGLAARYGGEEFAILLPGVTRTGAEAIADAARRVIGSQRLTKRSTGERIGVVTVSFGVVEFRASEGRATFVARADECLYAAKQNGRDRIVSDATIQEAA
jgi:diguanylate cyclase